MTIQELVNYLIGGLANGQVDAETEVFVLLNNGGAPGFSPDLVEGMGDCQADVEGCFVTSESFNLTLAQMVAPVDAHVFAINAIRCVQTEAGKILDEIAPTGIDAYKDRLIDAIFNASPEEVEPASMEWFAEAYEAYGIKPVGTRIPERPKKGKNAKL